MIGETIDGVFNAFKRLGFKVPGALIRRVLQHRLERVFAAEGQAAFAEVLNLTAAANDETQQELNRVSSILAVLMEEAAPDGFEFDEAEIRRIDRKYAISIQEKDTVQSMDTDAVRQEFVIKLIPIHHVQESTRHASDFQSDWKRHGAVHPADVGLGKTSRILAAQEQDAAPEGTTGSADGRSAGPHEAADRPRQADSYDSEEGFDYPDGRRLETSIGL